MAAPTKTEPALLWGTLASIVVLVLGLFDVVVEVDLVETLLLTAVPLVQAIITRFFVSPAPRAGV